MKRMFRFYVQNIITVGKLTNAVERFKRRNKTLFFQINYIITIKRAAFAFYTIEKTSLFYQTNFHD